MNVLKQLERFNPLDVPKLVSRDFFFDLHRNQRTVFTSRKKCDICGLIYGLWTREHHCRQCGLSICYQCSRMVTVRIGDPVIRLCNKCIRDYDNMRDINRLVEIFCLLGLDYRDIKAIACVCRLWGHASRKYNNILRQAIARFPDEPIDPPNYISNRAFRNFYASNRHLLSTRPEELLLQETSSPPSEVHLPFMLYLLPSHPDYILQLEKVSSYALWNYIALINNEFLVDWMRPASSVLIGWNKAPCNKWENFRLTIQNILLIVNENLNPIYALSNYLRDIGESWFYVEGDMKWVRWSPCIQIIDSHTRPILLHTAENRFLIKHENLIAEAHISHVIKYITSLTRDLVGEAIVTYDIVPLTDRWGYICFVEGATTCYDIREKQHMTLQNWLIEQSAPNYRTELVRSSAFWTVVCYLLGIGDRHLENIMITATGRIFHIDFGYVLGREPKYIAPEIRITEDLVDALGGEHSRDFALFIELSQKIFDRLIDRWREFYIILAMICDMNYGISRDYLRMFMRDRWRPRYIFTIIYRNRDGIKEGIIDYIHKAFKSSV